MNVMHSSLMKPRAFLDTLTTEFDGRRYDGSEIMHATLDRTFIAEVHGRQNIAVENFIQSVDCIMEMNEDYSHQSLYRYCPFDRDETIDSMSRPLSCYSLFFMQAAVLLKNSKIMQKRLSIIYDKRRRIK